MDASQCVTQGVAQRYRVVVADLPPDIRARRDVEDRAMRLRAERADIAARNAANIRAIVALLDDAKQAGVRLDDLAELVDVSRQSLHRWREAAVLKRVMDAESKGQG